MKKNIIIKSLLILIAIVMQFSVFSMANAQVVPGSGGNSGAGTGNSSGGGNSKINEGLNVVQSKTGLTDYVDGQDATSSITNIIIDIINVLLAIAAVVAVLFIIIGGYYYMTSGGNDEQTKKGKKYLTNASIGLAVIILSYTLVRLVVNVFS